MKKAFSLAVLLLVCALFLVSCGNKQDKSSDTAPQVLNIYSWSDYYAPEVIAAFEQQNNCKVTYDVFANNEEMLAKIQAGGAQFDIIQPSDYMVTTMLKLGLLEKLDLTQIPNLKNLSPDLQKPPFDPTGEYAPIYTNGITGIVYNKKYISTPPTSWADLWNPAYQGHVIVLNDAREVFSVALKKHGFSNNSTNPAEVASAYEDLQKLNRNILAYDTENIKQKFIAEEAWLGIMWSGDASYTLRENPNIGFIIPEQGTLIWADTIAIPKGCKNKVLAQKFINYMYDPTVSAKNFAYINLPNPNAAAVKLMPASYRQDPFLTLGSSAAHKGEWLVDIGDSITMYDRYWTRLKTAK
ncbi:MAG: spermidine/putrescine ABC transporter substrate-binding protein [Acidaminococcaceae bacterium]